MRPSEPDAPFEGATGGFALPDDFSEARLRAFLRYSRDLILLLGVDRRICFVSASIEHMFGYRPSNVLGHDVLDFLDPHDRSEVVRALEGARSAGSLVTRPLRVVHSDGSVRMVECRFTDALADPAVEGIVVNVRDVSERLVAEEEARLLRSALAEAGTGIIITDMEGHIRFVNEAVVQLWGAESPDAFLDRSVSEELFTDELQTETCRLRLAATGRCDGVFSARRLDGPDFEVQYVASVYLGPSGDPEGVLLNVFDITRQRDLERTVSEIEGRLRVEQDRFRHLIESATEGLLVLSAESIISYASPSAQKLLGSTAVRGADARAMIDEWAEAEEVAGIREATGSMGAAESAQWTLSLRLPDQVEPRQVELTITNLLDNPSIRGMVVHVRDVTERQLHLRELRDRSFTDDLTGLANRALLMVRLDEELQRVGSFPLGVLFLDLDHFKLVNDSYGHTVGDALLCTIASRLQQAVRDQDIVARFGGDEFVVVHRLDHDGSAGRAATWSLAERLLHEVSRPIDLGEVALTPSASIGVTFSDEVTRTSEALIRDADVALHRAKEEGRRRISLYDPQHRHAVLRRVRMEHDLAVAIDDRSLFVVYQPIVDLLTGDVVGCEALCRWDHPELGAVPPSEFIPVAEDTGRIGELGLWVVEAVCADLSDSQRWGGHAPDHVAVNVSALQFQDPGFGQALMRILATYGVSPARVVLEITESMLLADSAESRTSLEQLRSHGLRISIDDFGTGYSSLSYLARCPLDFIKVDRSFVADIQHQEHLVRAVVAMARALDAVVIAEGVETRDQLELLRELGCDHAQGYLLARPGSPEAMAGRIEPLQDAK